jgi:3-oxoacyl-[acyl-carrier protein] reductase
MELIARTQAEIERTVPKSATDALCLDVTRAEAVRDALGRVEKDYGRLDVLINNAGIIRDNWVSRLTDEDWNEVIAVNLTGAFNTCRVAAPGMRKRGYGRIVNITSRAWLGNPGQANYAASKAGLVGLTRALALELARFGVTVNAVAPGLIDTPLARSLHPDVRERLTKAQPGGRMGSPDEVAAAVAFLASTEAAFITGQVLHVCGGKSVGTGGVA